MKFILMLICLVLSLSAYAQDFKRVQNLVIGEQQLEAGYILSKNNAEYFMVPSEGDYHLRMQKLPQGVQVEVLTWKTLTSFVVPKGLLKGKFKATRQSVKHLKDLSTDEGVNYWFTYDVLPGEEEVDVTISSALFGKDSINDSVTATGTIEYRSCDGCEHGDQLLLSNINVAMIDFGSWYEFDCEGKIERLFESLLSEGPAVPFTFRGKINMNSGDLVEAVGDLWNATNTGELFIGSGFQLPVVEFLESVVLKTAKLRGVDAKVIRADLLMRGEFVSYQDNILVFNYLDTVIKFKLP